MTDRRELEESLLNEVTRRLAEISATQHELARHQRILAHAATQLRTGKGAESVLAEVREQSPELLQDDCSGSASQPVCTSGATLPTSTDAVRRRGALRATPLLHCGVIVEACGCADEQNFYPVVSSPAQL